MVPSHLGDDGAFVRLGPDIVTDLDAALRGEWLVTNGLGGYAFGTVAGIPTRRYHGHLIAALEPPVGRTVLVGALLETVTLGEDEAIPLHTLELADGTIVGGGYRHLTAFRLDGMLPVWTFALGDTTLEKRVWMAHEANTTYVRYRVLAGGAEVRLEVAPLMTARDHHDLPGPTIAAPSVVATDPRILLIDLPGPNGPCRLRIVADAGAFSRPAARPARHLLRHREETARGLDDRSELVEAPTLGVTLGPGDAMTLLLSTDAGVGEPEAPDLSLARALERQAKLVAFAAAEESSAPVRQLILAADQFIVRRRIPRPSGLPEEGRSIIAGYPWFNDWGRDTMIALPGLTLATGRAEEGATILRSFARFVRDGLVPNNFPDRIDQAPEYHTVDASLWYPAAISAYERATGDRSLVDELLPVVLDILEHHVAGTRFGIGMDPADGLIRAGVEGYQLTWMDAKVDDWVVTPRRGKPVEIQALWHNALRLASTWAGERGDAAAAERLASFADRAAASFGKRFWRPDLGYLADVVDGPDGDDRSLRPNQLIALSLPHPLVRGGKARSVLRACRAELLTPGGLRSLAPSDPAYRSHFQGDRRTRDGAYHQGTVWSWLIGPYVDAVLAVTGDGAHAREVLEPFVAHLSDAGLGTISECFEPEPPFEPRACVAQAWGVAEVLRLLRRLEAPQSA